MDDSSVNPAPFGVLWSVTQRCNLKCAYCLAEGSSTDFVELPFSSLIRIADKLIQCGTRNVALSGGEPFLRPDIFDLIDYLQAAGVRVTLNTNGTLVTREVARRLAEREVVTGVSLDGAKEVVNARTRSAGSFERAVRGAQHLVSEGVITSVLVTVTRRNFNRLLELCELVYGLGIRIVTLQDFHPVGRGSGQYERFALTRSQERRVLPTLGRIAERFPELKVNPTAVGYWATLCHPQDERVPKDSPMNLFEGKACNTGLYIDAAGTMYRCPSLSMLPLGNALEDDPMEAWESSEAARAYKMLASIPVGAIPGCADCGFNNLCCGGCRADAYTLTGDWLSPHPRCPRTG
jgi:radical SAM protein with 4Fe4S-binding SPASM domain